MGRALKLNPDGTLGWEKQNKFRNQPAYLCPKCCADHFPCCKGGSAQRFASSLELARFLELKVLEGLREITNLQTQVHYVMYVKDQHITTYVADFVYYDISRGTVVVEDTKSKATKTNEYRIKKKLMKALYQIDIQEVFAK